MFGLYLSMRLGDQLCLELLEKPDAIQAIDLYYTLVHISLAAACLWTHDNQGYDNTIVYPHPGLDS